MNKSGTPPGVYPKTPDEHLYLSWGEQIYFLFRAFLGIFQDLFLFFIPPAPKSVRGKTILVTGAAGALGYEVCRLLGSIHGAKIIMLDLNKDMLEGRAKELEDQGVDVEHHAFDITDSEELEAVAKDINSRRKIDILYVNHVLKSKTGGSARLQLHYLPHSGILPVCRFFEQSRALLDKTMTVNVISYIETIKLFAKSMVERNEGHIVMTTSVSASTGLSGGTVYAASKAALENLANSLEYELQSMNSMNVIVTRIYPAFIRTQLVDGGQVRCLDNSMMNAMTVEHVAEKAVYGILRNRRRQCMPVVLYSMYLLERMFGYKYRVWYARFLNIHVI